MTIDFPTENFFTKTNFLHQYLKPILEPESCSPVGMYRVVPGINWTVIPGTK